MTEQEDPELLLIAGRVAQLVELVGGQGAAAEVAGVSRATIQKWRTGKARPPLIEMTRLTRAAGLGLDWLVGGREADDAPIWLPMINPQSQGERMPFPQRAISERLSQGGNPAIYAVEGRELEPEINLGDLVVIDQSQKDISRSNGRVFLFERDGRRVLSRAFALSSTVVEVYTWEKKDKREKVAVADLPKLHVIGKVVLTLSEP